MSKIVLLSCTKAKLDHPVPAYKLYSASPTFRKTFEYGESLNPDKMFILSAKHYLVPLNKKLHPYDLTLKNMKAEEKEKWGKIVYKQMLDAGIDVEKDQFIFLTGLEYMKPLLPYIPKENIQNPLLGKRMGERMKWLNKQIKNIKEILKTIKKIIYEVISK